MNASVRQGFAAPAKLFLGLAQAQEKIMQLQDMFSQISARHKSAEQVSSWNGTEQHCSVFLRHVSWQGIKRIHAAFPRSNNPIRHIYLQVPAMGPMTFFGSLSYASPYLAASSTCIAAWTVSLYFAGSSDRNGHAHHGYFMDHRHISWLHESTFCRLYRASYDLTFAIYRMSEFMVDIPIYRIVSSPAISCGA